MTIHGIYIVYIGLLLHPMGYFNPCKDLLNENNKYKCKNRDRIRARTSWCKTILVSSAVHRVFLRLREGCRG
jgi:hypothetical protein